MNKAKNIVVTISRQQASGGAYIGHLLAKNLGFRYMEQEILSLTAKELGVNLADLAHKEECCDGFVEKMMKSFMYGTPEAGYAAPVRKPVLDEDLFLTESRIIKTIASSYDAVIVGRGGYSILAG
ncbi:MAG TPA: cytidylate kinase-like family protein, partial [Nitrospirota bacterium]|nr:cytidylate kinase-like family protein [Nitrospirota bacterium]